MSPAGVLFATFAVLMLLVSPAGLPGIARLILENVSRVLGFFERMLT